MADWFDILAGEGSAALAAAVALANCRMEKVEQLRSIAVIGEQSREAWEARSAELSRQQAMLVQEIAMLKTRMAAVMSALVAQCEAVAVANLLASAKHLVGNDIEQLTPAQLRSRLEALGPHVERSRQAFRQQLTSALGAPDDLPLQLYRRAGLSAELEALKERRRDLTTALLKDHAVDQAVLDAIDGLTLDDLIQYGEELDVLLQDARIEKNWRLSTEVLAEMRQ